MNQASLNILNKLTSEFMEHSKIVNISMPPYIILFSRRNLWIYSVDDLRIVSGAETRKYTRDENATDGKKLGFDANAFIDDMHKCIINQDIQLFVSNNTCGSHQESWSLVDLQFAKANCDGC